MKSTKQPAKHNNKAINKKHDLNEMRWIGEQTLFAFASRYGRMPDSEEEFFRYAQLCSAKTPQQVLVIESEVEKLFDPGEASIKLDDRCCKLRACLLKAKTLRLESVQQQGSSASSSSAIQPVKESRELKELKVREAVLAAKLKQVQVLVGQFKAENEKLKKDQILYFNKLAQLNLQNHKLQDSIELLEAKKVELEDVNFDLDIQNDIVKQDLISRIRAQQTLIKFQNDRIIELNKLEPSICTEDNLCKCCKSTKFYSTPFARMPCGVYLKFLRNGSPNVKWNKCVVGGCHKAHPNDLDPKGREVCDLFEFTIKARKTLDVCMYSFTKFILVNEIYLLARKVPKVRVRIIIDYANRHNIKKLVNDDLVDVRYVTTLSQDAVMHTKFAIVDGKHLLTGSLNWTEGMTKNIDTFEITQQTARVREYAKLFEELYKDSLKPSD